MRFSIGRTCLCADTLSAQADNADTIAPWRFDKPEPVSPAIRTASGQYAEVGGSWVAPAIGVALPSPVNPRSLLLQLKVFGVRSCRLGDGVLATKHNRRRQQIGEGQWRWTIDGRGALELERGIAGGPGETHFGRVRRARDVQARCRAGQTVNFQAVIVAPGYSRDFRDLDSELCAGRDGKGEAAGGAKDGAAGVAKVSVAIKHGK